MQVLVGNLQAPGTCIDRVITHQFACCRNCVRASDGFIRKFFSLSIGDRTSSAFQGHVIERHRSPPFGEVHRRYLNPRDNIEQYLNRYSAALSFSCRAASSSIRLTEYLMTSSSLSNSSARRAHEAA